MRTRTASANETYDSKEGIFKTTAKCPFCRRINRYDDLAKKTCAHFRSVQHGCGGTIFVFKERTV